MTTNVVMKWKQKLGQSLRRARERFDPDMTQEALADAAGLARNTIGYYERGQRAPNFGDLQKIAALLKADYFEIDENIRIEFTANGKPRPDPPQQLELKFDANDGVTVRIQSVPAGIVVRKVSA